MSPGASVACRDRPWPVYVYVRVWMCVRISKNIVYRRYAQPLACMHTHMMHQTFMEYASLMYAHVMCIIYVLRITYEFTYMFTRNESPLRAYAHAHACVPVYVCVYVCVCMRGFTSLQREPIACAYTFVRTCVCVWVCVRVYGYVRRIYVCVSCLWRRGSACACVCIWISTHIE